MSITQPVVTVIIVTYNSIKHINAALAALFFSYSSGYLKCIVVDNASRDGTADFIASSHPWVNIIRSESNLGFGRGCNLGYQQVSTPYILIHNPDAVIESDSLKILELFLNTHKNAGIVGPAIIENENIIQAAGLMVTPISQFYSLLGFSNAFSQKKIIFPYNLPFQTSWVCGAMMFIRSDLYCQLGGFDPRFFLYFEETDFCRRATQKGYEIWAVGQAIAHHIGGESAKSTEKTMESSCITEHFNQSRFYYFVKHYGWFIGIGTELLIGILQYIRFFYHILFKINISFLQFPALPRDTK